MDAERLLGGLIWGALRGGVRRPGRGMLGLGVLGLAVAAYEHFSQQRAMTGGSGGARPLPPAVPAGPGVMPPPPPGRPVSPPEPPPAPPAARVPGSPGGAGREAVLLIRAMIAAAYADSHLDAEERERIQSRLEGAGLGPEERAFLEREMAAPVPVSELVAGATTPELAEQVYAASLLAIDVDTPEERGYLAGLARLLGLDGETVARLHLLAGAPRP